ncbi:DNA-binding protein RHL1 [Magnolia sinica]|uniref:DNA-binding protein RHL1 n=1 Tax=Magnolia sinica TaxID=86752 RepID=UPI0026588354|nr:DNA-binding protein RHL1 [Magnolia sinica]
MVRPASSSGKKPRKDEKSQTDPETEDRRRLKSLAFSKNLLSHTPSKPISPLNPSKTLEKHRGRDILKKGQRKNRFLFSFPGLLAPISAGKIGELKDLGTKNPVLYIDFPQGRMKLFGTIVYPKNKYLTFQFARSSKNVMCEDCFENMVVFSDAWWIGRRDENPEEVQLEFPKEIDEGKHADFDFKGGAGATSGETSGINKPRKEYVEPISPETESKDDVSDDSDLLTAKTSNVAMETTPVRQSARTAGRTFKFAESSGDESADSDADMSKMKDENIDDEVNGATRSSLLGKTEDSSVTACSPQALGNVDVEMKTPGKVQQSSLSVKKSKGKSPNKRGTLVQATIATLFEKVEEKKSTSVKKSPPLKGSSRKKQPINSNQKATQEKAKGASKKGMQTKGKKAGKESVTKQKHSQVEDDDTEDISSETQGTDDDEEWAA